MQKIFLLISFIVLVFLSPTQAQAEEIIHNFHTKIVAHQNGDMTITETIQYDFNDLSRHGIYRFIPTYTKVGDYYRISEINFNSVKRDGKDEPNEKSYNADQVEVKIGDPDRTIDGIHTYEIQYEIKNGIGSNFDTFDEIYWNMTGNKWKIPIEKASAEITTDFSAVPTKSLCFTGSLNSKEQLCESKIVNQSSQTVSTKLLEAQEGLTVATAYPVNTFPKSQLSKDPPLLGKDAKIIFTILGIVWFILNLIVAPLVLRWYLKNKRKDSFGKPAVNFDIPKDSNGNIITPAEAGIIDNTRLDQNDVMATIFDLAIKRYLKIEQIEKKKTLGVFGGGEEYQLVKLKEPDDHLNDFEQTLMHDLLATKDIKKLSEVKGFYVTFQNLEEKSFESLITRGFYVKNPKGQKASLLIFGLIASVTLSLILGPLLIYLSTKLNGRTSLGDKFDWQVEGLKIFLKNMKRHYNFQVKNAITVEKYIPYAMAFGFIEEFMDQIKEIYPNYSPTWYSGHTPFYHAQTGMLSSMSSNFTTSAPSSSSGSGGGGFSGGGGGGGGGGSW